MKQIILFLLVFTGLALASSCAGADVLTYPNCEGEKNSSWDNCSGGFRDEFKTFKGYFKNGKREGYGVANFFNGDSFEGFYADDKAVKGVFKFANGNLFEGEMNGQAQYLFANGTFNKGAYKDGKKNGYGETIYNDGKTFKGIYENVEAKDGIVTDPKGFSYLGKLTNNKFQVDGKYFYYFEHNYEGNFKNGLRDGLGVERFPNGDKFEGNFVNGVKEGRGVYTYANGDYYEALFQNNLPVLLLSYQSKYDYSQYDMKDYKYVESIEIVKKANSYLEEYEKKWIKFVLPSSKEQKVGKDHLAPEDIQLNEEKKILNGELTILYEELKSLLKNDNSFNETQKAFIKGKIKSVHMAIFPFTEDSYLALNNEISEELTQNYSKDHPYYSIGQELNFEYAMAKGSMTQIRKILEYFNSPDAINARAAEIKNNDSNALAYCLAKDKISGNYYSYYADDFDKEAFAYENLISSYPCLNKEEHMRRLRSYGMHAHINGHSSLAEEIFLHLEKLGYDVPDAVCEGQPCEVVDKKYYAFVLKNMGKQKEALQKLEQAKTKLQAGKPICGDIDNCDEATSKLDEAKLRILDDDISLEIKIKQFIQNDEYSFMTKSYSFENLSIISEKRNDLAEAIFLQKIAVYHAYLDYLQITKGATNKDSPRVFTANKGFDLFNRRLTKLLINANRLSEADDVMNNIKDYENIEFTRGADESINNSITEVKLNSFEKIWMDKYKISLQRSNKEKNDRALESYLFHVHEGFKSLKETSEIRGSLENNDSLLGRLPKNTALLRFFVMEDRLDVIVTTSESKIVKSIKINEKLLNQKIFDFRTLLKSPAGDPNQVSNELFTIIFSPLVAELRKQKIDNLILSLDKNLRYLPFSALYDGKNYLIQNFSLALYLKELNGSTDKNSNDYRIAGFGVTRQYEGFKSLPSVRNEIESIVKVNQRGLIPGKIFLDAAFTANQLKSSGNKDFSILHISSHFVFSPGTEENSYLLTGDGGKLSLKDLRTQNYRFPSIDLVTLSACDTAQGGGTDEKGREIDGMADLLIRNGAKSVMATLWKVEDSSTAELMRDFYTAYTQDSSSKADALRLAQLKMINNKSYLSNPLSKNINYSHPFFWAPFILIDNQIKLSR